MFFYVRQTPARLLIGLCGLALSGLVYAIPGPVVTVDCSGSSCSVSNNGWLVESNSGEHDLVNFSYNGIDHLWEEEFHLGFGTSIPSDGNRADQDISDLLTLSLATENEGTDTIETVFIGSGLTATVTRQLTAASANGATLMETIELADTSAGDAGPVNLWLIEYTDWDLNDNEFNDTASYNPANTTFTQTSGATTSTIRALTAPGYYDIAQGTGEDPLLYDNIVAGHLGNHQGPLGPADVKHAFQYNLTYSPWSIGNTPV